MPQTILIVDDDEIVLRLVCTILGGAGYRVLPASNGEEALTVWRGHAVHIDLALIDVMMPGMSGPELHKRLQDERPDVRTLFMSGYTYDQLTGQGIHGGSGNLLVKPFTISALIHAVEGRVAAVPTSAVRSPG